MFINFYNSGVTIRSDYNYRHSNTASNMFEDRVVRIRYRFVTKVVLVPLWYRCNSYRLTKLYEKTWVQIFGMAVCVSLHVNTLQKGDELKIPFFCGFLHMDMPVLADQQELIDFSSVRSLYVVWKTCCERWMIGEREREIVKERESRWNPSSQRDFTKMIGK